MPDSGENRGRNKGVVPYEQSSLRMGCSLCLEFSSQDAIFGLRKLPEDTVEMGLVCKRLLLLR